MARLDTKIAQLVVLAQRCGWRARRTANTHLLLLSPDGKHVVTVAHSSSHRKFKKLRADFRRAGLTVP